MDLEKAGREADFHDLIEHEFTHLPLLHGDEDKNDIDAGQEDHLLGF